MISRLVSFWDGLFSAAMLVSGRVPFNKLRRLRLGGLAFLEGQCILASLGCVVLEQLSESYLQKGQGHAKKGWRKQNEYKLARTKSAQHNNHDNTLKYPYPKNNRALVISGHNVRSIPYIQGAWPRLKPSRISIFNQSYTVNVVLNRRTPQFQLPHLNHFGRSLPYQRQHLGIFHVFFCSFLE